MSYRSWTGNATPNRGYRKVVASVAVRATHCEDRQNSGHNRDTLPKHAEVLSVMGTVVDPRLNRFTILPIAPDDSPRQLNPLRQPCAYPGTVTLRIGPTLTLLMIGQPAFKR